MVCTVSSALAVFVLVACVFAIHHPVTCFSIQSPHHRISTPSSSRKKTKHFLSNEQAATAADPSLLAPASSSRRPVISDDEEDATAVSSMEKPLQEKKQAVVPSIEKPEEESAMHSAMKGGELGDEKYKEMMQMMDKDDEDLDFDINEVDLSDTSLYGEPLYDPVAAAADGPVQDREAHVKLMDDNFHRVFGKTMLEHMGKELAEDENEDEAFWEVQMSLKYAVMSHGANDEGINGPMINYGNHGALAEFGYTWNQFTQLPTNGLSKSDLDQEEWKEVLRVVRKRGKQGYHDKYRGFRCNRDDLPFFIRDGLIWNLYDENDRYCGQAIMFDRTRAQTMTHLPFQESVMEEMIGDRTLEVWD
mmetsp:Transcript_31857/g.73188  ORF Transcript_31857/g.73188 Transcript_31857/m.73188 type:complete len:361 (+) Transcript_31857:13-1095(+)